MCRRKEELIMQMDLKNIPVRIKELREILEIEPQDMANQLGVSLINYLSFESGEQDIPISTLYEIASILNVEFTTLLTGRSPKMETYTVTRKGGGRQTAKEEGIDIRNLAPMFRKKISEPYYVKYEYHGKYT